MQKTLYNAYEDYGTWNISTSKKKEFCKVFKNKYL